jgi:hypothetical protein
MNCQLNCQLPEINQHRNVCFSNLKTNRDHSTEIIINDCILRYYMKYLSKLYHEIQEFQSPV